MKKNSLKKGLNLAVALIFGFNTIAQAQPAKVDTLRPVSLGNVSAKRDIAGSLKSSSAGKEFRENTINELQKLSSTLNIRGSDLVTGILSSLIPSQLITDIAEGGGRSTKEVVAEFKNYPMLEGIIARYHDKPRSSLPVDVFGDYDVNELVDLINKISRRQNVSIQRMTNVIFDCIEPTTFVKRLAVVTERPDEDVAKILQHNAVLGLIGTSYRVLNLKEEANGNMITLSANDIVNPAVASEYASELLDIKVTLPEGFQVDEGMYEAVMAHFDQVTTAAQKREYNYRGDVWAHYEEFLKNEAKVYDGFIEDNFGSRDNIKYLITSGIGANEMYSHLMAALHNSSGRGLRWIVVDAPSDIKNLPVDATAENTLFFEMSRSGSTQETLKLLQLTHKRFPKRIVYANKGPLRKQAEALSGLPGYSILVRDIAQDIGGRLMRRKTPLLLGPMYLAGMDTAAYFKATDGFDAKLDFAKGPDSLAVGLARFLYICVVLGNRHNMALMYNNREILRASAKEIRQLWMEGANKKPEYSLITSTHEFPRDPHASMEGVLGQSASHIGLGIVARHSGSEQDKKTVITDADLEGLRKDPEQQHAGLSIDEVEYAFAAPNVQKCQKVMPTISIELDSVALQTASALTTLYEDMVVHYCALTGQDPNSNPQVKAVREDTADLLRQMVQDKGSIKPSPAGKAKDISADSADFRLFKTLEGHTDRVYSASFSPDGKKIVTASSDKTARIWSLAEADSAIKSSSAGKDWTEERLIFDINVINEAVYKGDATRGIPARPEFGPDRGRDIVTSAAVHNYLKKPDEPPKTLPGIGAPELEPIEREGRIMAYMVYGDTVPPEIRRLSGDGIYIHFMAVHTAARDQHLGERLFRKAVSVAQQSGKDRIMLNVNKNNPYSVLYDKMAELPEIDGEPIIRNYRFPFPGVDTYLYIYHLKQQNADIKSSSAGDEQGRLRKALHKTGTQVRKAAGFLGLSRKETPERPQEVPVEKFSFEKFQDRQRRVVVPQLISSMEEIITVTMDKVTKLERETARRELNSDEEHALDLHWRDIAKAALILSYFGHEKVEGLVKMVFTTPYSYAKGDALQALANINPKKAVVLAKVWGKEREGEKELLDACLEAMFTGQADHLMEKPQEELQETDPRLKAILESTGIDPASEIVGKDREDIFRSAELRHISDEVADVLVSVKDGAALSMIRRLIASDYDRDNIRGADLAVSLGDPQLIPQLKKMLESIEAHFAKLVSERGYDLENPHSWGSGTLFRERDAQISLARATLLLGDKDYIIPKLKEWFEFHLRLEKKGRGILDSDLTRGPIYTIARILIRTGEAGYVVPELRAYYKELEDLGEIVVGYSYVQPVGPIKRYEFWGMSAIASLLLDAKDKNAAALIQKLWERAVKEGGLYAWKILLNEIVKVGLADAADFLKDKLREWETEQSSSHELDARDVAKALIGLGEEAGVRYLLDGINRPITEPHRRNYNIYLRFESAQVLIDAFKLYKTKTTEGGDSLTSSLKSSSAGRTKDISAITQEFEKAESALFSTEAARLDTAILDKTVSTYQKAIDELSALKAKAAKKAAEVAEPLRVTEASLGLMTLSKDIAAEEAKIAEESRIIGKIGTIIINDAEIPANQKILLTLLDKENSYLKALEEKLGCKIRLLSQFNLAEDASANMIAISTTKIPAVSELRYLDITRVTDNAYLPLEQAIVFAKGLLVYAIDNSDVTKGIIAQMYRLLAKKPAEQKLFEQFLNESVFSLVLPSPTPVDEKYYQDLHRQAMAALIAA